MGIFKNKFLILIAMLVILTLTNVKTYAADSLYRFMHNDHDALVIGEITEAEGENITVKVYKSVISKRDLNANSPKKQISIEEAKITGVKGYYYKHAPQVGDYVAASLNKKDSAFIVANGIFKVDSTDYKNLSILYESDATEYTKMDGAAIKAFINSDGQLTEFGFDGNTKRVISQQENKIIYDGSAETSNTELKQDNNAGSSPEPSAKESFNIEKQDKIKSQLDTYRAFIIALVPIGLVAIMIYGRKYHKG